MTTNHLEKLDPALLRPGRTDVKVHLNYASEKQIQGIFERFFPSNSESNPEGKYTIEFSKALPVDKLSMAKIQGHLLKYRHSAQVCTERARELVEDEDLSMTKEMSIDEWLHRLNMLHTKKHFDKQKIRRVSDLQYIDEEGKLEEIGVEKKEDRRRLWLMIKGDSEAKDHFKFLTNHSIRNIASHFLSNDKVLD
mmetsp:Transcript_25710/g.19439  ORF Transcript_25710/g.19439 Transcript_25710/m.19439 type:complete len:194 (+) Transcript_25710:957-1538(+)